MSKINAKFLGFAFVREVPAGAINGSNANFTLAAAPVRLAALVVTVNGLVQDATDFTLSDKTITFLTAPAVGATIQAYYMRAN